MAWLKRIGLFLAVNALVVITISVILNLLGVKPYLTPYGLDYQSLMIFCLIWGMGGAFISLALSRVMAKWMMGVQIIPPDTRDPELQGLVQMVHEMSRAARLPAMPEVGIYESPEVNAFATGPTKARSLVAVSSGLLHRMGKEEVRGVIGHEVAHIANGDMVTMTLIQGVVNAFVMFLARAIAYALTMSRGQDSEERSGTLRGAVRAGNGVHDPRLDGGGLVLALPRIPGRRRRRPPRGPEQYDPGSRGAEAHLRASGSLGPARDPGPEDLEPAGRHHGSIFHAPAPRRENRAAEAGRVVTS
jgi:hypothetical protein